MRGEGWVLLIFLLSGWGQAQKLEFTNPDGLPMPERYTQIVKAGKLLFISGQVGRDANGRIVGPGMREQLDQTLANVKIALRSQGADVQHIAKITTFVTDMLEYQSAEVRAMRTKHFGNHRPASTSFQVEQLANPAYKVEVEAIAVLP